jgi:hypothetical protein
MARKLKCTDLMRLSILAVVLLIPLAAQARPNDKISRWTSERHKRLGIARSQMRRAYQTHDTKLYLKARKNRALASGLKVKLYRAKALQARAQADKLSTTDPKRRALQTRADRLSSMATRLHRAIGRYRSNSETIAKNAATDRAQQRSWASKAIGSPINRLWYTPSTEADHQRLYKLPNRAATRLALKRTMMESLTYAKPLSTTEVTNWLRQLPGTGRNSVSFSEAGPKGSVHTWKLVRTRTVRGKPRGYIRSSWKDPDSGEKITQFHGTSTSWVRRSLGPNMTTVVVHNRARRRKDGSIAIPAGTVSTVSREATDSAWRTSVHTETLDGRSRQRTTTYLADGRKEVYIGEREKDKMGERRVRYKADGSWNLVEKLYNPSHGLVVGSSDSRGRHNEKQIPYAKEQRLFSRLSKRLAEPTARISHYKKGDWRWKHQISTFGQSLGTIAAHGKDGELGSITSGYVSPLGTRYGEVREVVQPAHRAVTRKGRRPVKTRLYHINKLNNPYPKQQPQKQKQVTEADNRRLERAEQLVSRFRERPIKFLIDEGVAGNNAYARPMDNTVFSRVGPNGSHLQAINNVDVARVGKGVAKSSLSEQVGVGFHEGQHERQERIFGDPKKMTPTIQGYNLYSVGRHLSAEVAGLLHSDLRRSLERDADQRAGRGTAQVRKSTGDPAMTPKDYVKGNYGPKGIPHSRTWQPKLEYDSPRQRSRTTWRAYGQELKH